MLIGRSVEQRTLRENVLLTTFLVMPAVVFFACVCLLSRPSPGAQTADVEMMSGALARTLAHSEPF
jgi:hypothetical protein